MWCVFIVAVMTMIGIGATAYNQRASMAAQESANSTASQMSAYHMQAVRMCTAPLTCPAGPVNIVLQPGSNMQITNMNAKFRSYYDGTVIVTTVTDAYSSNARGATYNGMLNTALSGQTSMSVLAGPYNPDTLSVSDPNHLVNIMSPDGTLEYSRGQLGANLVNIPANVGGLTLSANMPVIATPVF